MTGHDPNHTLRPEFRAALEREIVRVFHEEARPAVAFRHRLTRFRTPMTLAAGLVLGISTQLAIGQVQRGRERSELEVSIDVKRAIAGSRLELARAAFAQAKKSFDLGATSRAELLTAEAELRVQEAAAYRVEFELDEVRETALAPRDELWAPLVAGRDFVKDRLNADAVAANQKLRAIEAAAADVERNYRVGLATKAVLAETQMSLEQAKADLELLAYKLMLRRQALEEHLTPQVIAQRLERFELARAVPRAQRQLELSQSQLQTAREQRSGGTIEEVELLRLQVKVLEAQAELQRLQARLLKLVKGID